MSEVNSMYFSKEMTDAGELTAFIEYLMNLSYGKGDYYNDIRIHPADCGAFDVEWIQVPWDREFGGEFKYVGEDQKIFTEYHMPDGTYMSFETKEDYEEEKEEILKNMAK